MHEEPLVHYADPYPGGWQDILPNRARFGDSEIGRSQEGEAACLPWDYEIRREEGEVSLICRVSLAGAPLSAVKTFRLAEGESVLSLEEEVANTGEEPVRFIWTHHPAFGSPLVDERARVNLPEGARVFADAPGALDNAAGDSPREALLPDGRRKDLHRIDSRRPDGESGYFPLAGFEQGEAGIDNPHLRLRLRLEWDRSTFPCLRYWSRNDEEIYTVALEPSTSRYSDIGDCIRHGECIALDPGERHSAWLRVRFESYS
nr:DUF4432 family protein [Cohnella zeiphila]